MGFPGTILPLIRSTDFMCKITFYRLLEAKVGIITRSGVKYDYLLNLFFIHA